MHVWNGERYQKATSPAHAQLIRNIRQKFNEEIDTQFKADAASPIFQSSSTDDNDVDCFPRQDKQPALQQQDISPTDTLPSLIESPTDTPATEN